MERVGVLINKLQEQLADKAGIDHLLVTTQLLQSELLLQSSRNGNKSSSKVAVIIPNGFGGNYVSSENKAVDVTNKDPDKVTDTAPLYADTSVYVSEPADIQSFYKPVIKSEPGPAPVEEIAGEPVSLIPQPEPLPTPRPEPEPIPHFAEEKPWQRLFVNKDEKETPWTVDPVMEIPTLAHQEKVVYELNDVMVSDTPASINDKLKPDNAELGSKLHDMPVKDLKKAISINDRHRFIHELFRDDETMYERSVKTINGFHIFAEAEYWIQRELKVKLGWDTGLELVKVFDQVVKRRFS